MAARDPHDETAMRDQPQHSRRDSSARPAPAPKLFIFIKRLETRQPRLVFSRARIASNFILASPRRDATRLVSPCILSHRDASARLASHPDVSRRVAPTRLAPTRLVPTRLDMSRLQLLSTCSLSRLASTCSSPRLACSSPRLAGQQHAARVAAPLVCQQLLELRLARHCSIQTALVTCPPTLPWRWRGYLRSGCTPVFLPAP